MDMTLLYKLNEFNYLFTQQQCHQTNSNENKFLEFYNEYSNDWIYVECRDSDSSINTYNLIINPIYCIKDCDSFKFKKTISNTDLTHLPKNSNGINIGNQFIFNTLDNLDLFMRHFKVIVLTPTKDDITIPKEIWVTLLKNEIIFTEKALNILCRIYTYPNHATTCTQLSKIDNTSPSSYNSTIVSTGKKILNLLKLSDLRSETNKPTFWPIFFEGRWIKNKYFEWKLHPELANALLHSFPHQLSDDTTELELELDSTLTLNCNNITSFSFNTDLLGTVRPKQKFIEVNSHLTYPRNHKTSAQALCLANHQCELNSNHPTFIRKTNNKPYTEPHHLIPLSYATEFKYSLDIEENIISLCSNCHNQLHYGIDIAPLLTQLYNDRSARLKQCGIELTLEMLLSFYGV